MSQSESTMKTQNSPTKRFHLSHVVNHVLKFFSATNHVKQDEQQRRKNRKTIRRLYFLLFDSFRSISVMKLPSISITTPDGQTTLVE